MPPIPKAAHLVGVVSALFALRRVKRPEPPAHFCCSVTGELFEDPVIVTSTGHTYERAAIEAWFASHSPPTDPMTNLRCDATLVPNWALRDALNEWRAAHGRSPLAPPAPCAPPPLKRASGDALDGPLGTALTVLVTLVASLVGGIFAAVFGTAPVASLIIVLLTLAVFDADGAGAARAAAVGAAMARRRAA